MLAEQHAQPNFVRRSSELLFHTHIHLFSCSPSTSWRGFQLGRSWACPPMSSMKRCCPVSGCGERSDRWGKKSYPLPSAGSFTLQLNAQLDVSINNRICQPCWERHRDPTMRLDGRTQVAPTVSSSPLDALLSAAIHPLLPSPPPSNLPTPARVIAPLPPHPIDSSDPALVRAQSLFSPSTVQVQSNHTSNRLHLSPSRALFSSCPRVVSRSLHLLRAPARRRRQRYGRHRL